MLEIFLTAVFIIQVYWLDANNIMHVDDAIQDDKVVCPSRCIGFLVTFAGKDYYYPASATSFDESGKFTYIGPWDPFKDSP